MINNSGTSLRPDVGLVATCNANFDGFLTYVSSLPMGDMGLCLMCCYLGPYECPTKWHIVPSNSFVMECMSVTVW